MTGVLVAYATKHGSTAEIAGMVANAIRTRGLEADVLPCHEVRSLDRYDLVVVGSAIYSMRWQRDGIEFLRRFSLPLAARPTWLFSSGPIGGKPEAEAVLADLIARQPAAPGEAGQLAEEIGARGHATFGGRISDEMNGFLERWLPKGDWRDRARIEAWGHAIVDAFEAESDVLEPA